MDCIPLLVALVAASVVALEVAFVAAFEVALGRYLLDHPQVGTEKAYLVVKLEDLLGYMMVWRIVSLASPHQMDPTYLVDQDTDSKLITYHEMECRKYFSPLLIVSFDKRLRHRSVL